jgi:hypothetical protein
MKANKAMRGQQYQNTGRKDKGSEGNINSAACNQTFKK